MCAHQRLKLNNSTNDELAIENKRANGNRRNRYLLSFPSGRSDKKADKTRERTGHIKKNYHAQQGK